MNSDAFFWQIQDGRAPPPRIAKTLGITITDVDATAGTLTATFVATEDFTNPAGNVQGGILAAMLDDTMGPALAAMLDAGEFAPTLNLNVQFLAPAKPGALLGKGKVVKRGGGICFLSGELWQAERLVAVATATAAVRRL